MRVSAALQILTTVMSGTTGNADNDWSPVQHVQQQQQLDFTAPRADLDLGACLDVETLDDFTNNLYNDADTTTTTTTTTTTAVQQAWMDNVIDMTSSGELTSSDDHTTGVVPHHAELVPVGGGFPLAGSLSVAETAATASFEFGGSLADTDNAVFNPLQVLTSAALEANLMDGSVPDFAQFGSLNNNNSVATATTTTIDMTALEQFVTLDSDTTMALKNSLEDSSEDFTTSTAITTGMGSDNIPNSLWNLDLELPSAVTEESQPCTSSSSGVPQDVKETLKNRLYSRGSVNSVSMDSDVNAASSSTRSMSSPTSSLTQSFDEDEIDDPVKMLEKREKNRVAAQKCRNKKREKEETLQKSVSRLEERQEKLKEEVQKLRDQRETLEEIINVHGIVCPKIRKISKS